MARAKAGEPADQLRGVVQDPSGAAVRGAEVKLHSGKFSVRLITNDQGFFVFGLVPVQTLRLTVKAPGFATAERNWNAGSPKPFVITLEPATVSERVTVTATRTPTRLSDTATNVLVLTPQDISSAAALNLDDVLRQVPGFSLFRRSSSRSANPTTQGVSLRGVGASGASRALVLVDGMPLNDPFGGWVYWDRVPRASVSRVEVVRGGASDLYGTSAMGGVVNFLTSRADGPTFSLDTSWGNQDTPDASFWGGIPLGAWRVELAAEAMRTGGYILVDPAERGVVDTPAGSEHETASLKLERETLRAGRAFVETSIFRETRKNGTPIQTNRTHLRQIALGGDWQFARLGAVSLRAYGGPQVYDQTFSAIAPGRDSENLNRIQRVPAQQVGLTLQWSRAVGSRQTLVAGVESREVRGASDEIGYFGGTATSATGAGGRQRTEGIYGEDIIRITPRWITTLGARFDHWRNFDALSTTRPLATTGPVTVTNFTDRTESAFSPRLGTLYRLTGNLSLNGSVYRAFRAPTLNELFRGFRVGNVVTQPKSDLLAERLTGAEAGAEVDAFSQRLKVRGTFFWSDITRPISNVTLIVQPNLITRQRQNLGRTRSRGFDLDATARLTRTLDFSAGYEFADAKVLRFSADPSLEGLEIPQTPRHALTFQARYSNPSAANRFSRWTLALQGRFVGTQFEDDTNLLRLGRYFTLDAFISKPLRHNVEAFVAAENLFDERYAVGRTPVLTLGPPLLVRGGVRMQWGSR